jgi:hypothetical protein
METFKIASIEKLDDFNVIGDKSKVSEVLFYKILNYAIEEIIHQTKEDQLSSSFDQAFYTAKKYLLTNQNKGLTIGSIWFSILESEIAKEKKSTINNPDYYEQKIKNK